MNCCSNSVCLKIARSLSPSLPNTAQGADETLQKWRQEAQMRASTVRDSKYPGVHQLSVDNSCFVGPRWVGGAGLFSAFGPLAVFCSSRESLVAPFRLLSILSGLLHPLFVIHSVSVWGTLPSPFLLFCVGKSSKLPTQHYTLNPKS